MIQNTDLEKALQASREAFDQGSLERSKHLGAVIESWTTEFPKKRLFIKEGMAHILIEQERKALELNKYPHGITLTFGEDCYLVRMRETKVFKKLNSYEIESQGWAYRKISGGRRAKKGKASQGRAASAFCQECQR